MAYNVDIKNNVQQKTGDKLITVDNTKNFDELSCKSEEKLIDDKGTSETGYSGKSDEKLIIDEQPTVVLEVIENNNMQVMEKMNNPTDSLPEMNDSNNIITNNTENAIKSENISSSSMLHSNLINDPSSPISSKNEIIELDENNLSSLQIKPVHWDDNYWISTISKFKWFLHRDDYIGCSHCYCNPENKGRSLIAKMKLYLMDLTFDDLEAKLVAHRSSNQHLRSLTMVRLNRRSYSGAGVPIEEEKKVVVKRSLGFDKLYPCPLCEKPYKTRKALANHVYICRVTDQNSIKCNCVCGDLELQHLSEMDAHNKNCHNNLLTFICKYCNGRVTKFSQLFYHQLLLHNHVWNPMRECPEIVESAKPVVNVLDAEPTPRTSAAGRPVRNKPKADSLWLNDEDMDNVIAGKHIVLEQKPKRRRISHPTAIKVPQTVGGPAMDVNYHVITSPLLASTQQVISVPIATPYVTEERRLDNSISLEPVSKLKIPLDSILQCQYCSGRYLSIEVLNNHIESTHSEAAQLQKESRAKNRIKVHKKLANLFDKNPTTDIAELVESDSAAEVAQKRQEQLDAHKSAAVLSCQACGLLCADVPAKIAHIAAEHSQFRDVTCPYCGLIFSNRHSFSTHLRGHSATLSSMTPVPFKTTPNPGVTCDAAAVHVFTCELCPLVFTSSTDLDNHTQWSHQVPPHSSAGLTSPSQPTETVIPAQPEIPAQTTEGQLQQDSAVVAAIDEAAIEVINIETDDMTLVALMNVDHGAADCCVCEQCGWCAHNPYELLVHSMRHGRDESEVASLMPACPACSRLFFGERARRHLLDHHGSEHRGAPPPTCNSCSRQFASSYLLEAHNCAGTADCRPLHYQDDPYWLLNLEEKLAFLCARCGAVVAGQDARNRMDAHMLQCSQDLLD